MVGVQVKKALFPEEKVTLMQQDAAYDLASSDDRAYLHLKTDIRSKKAAPTVPKVFLANDCIFNCAYCGCRCGNEKKTQYVCTPRELAELSVAQAKREKHGIFISSAIYKNPDYTEELIIEAMRIIRRELHYGGYLHAKVMPGTDPMLIRQAGFYANRLSVNIEVAKSEGYRRVAVNKTRQNILGPMGDIHSLIQAAREDASSRWRMPFATSQTTQLMAGSSNEDDRTILRLSGALYKKYGLSRVYYTAFTYRHRAAGYDDLPLTQTPPWRMARLYQADRLMQEYGFSAEEIAPEEDNFLHADLEPKAVWALRNLHRFPVEINNADFDSLLRVPGIGVTGAKRILIARHSGLLTHDNLTKIGVSLKRSRHFITCGGKFLGVDDPLLLPALLSDKPKRPVIEQLRLPLGGEEASPAFCE